MKWKLCTCIKNVIEDKRLNLLIIANFIILLRSYKIIMAISQIHTYSVIHNIQLYNTYISYEMKL